MKVKLTPGRAVRFPDNGQLLPENSPVEVPDNTFWRRRLRDGDVIRIPENKGAH
ncbi:DUF2635 domain-containing protein [Enterobacter cancerogenus]|uniref:DUF2635 domain-containing protein n=1 Tax=Enterobacter cancerogenus TaxID=69218 RepID=UPI003850EFC7